MSEPDMQSVADATVIILAYTMDRWSLTCDAVESVLEQTVPPKEIVLCVEDNPQLADRFRERWRDRLDGVPSIRVVEGQYEGEELTPAADEQERLSYGCHGSRIGAERTRGVRLAATEIVAFLDDDAKADPDWLVRLLAPFADNTVVAVGGAPLPVYAKPRPRWFPFEFEPADENGPRAAPHRREHGCSPRERARGWRLPVDG
jgi:cellulose synthase/poly-beta-1,6-N-acetylglucosamine synthase-like glycosyltransferase